jgi:NTE family protein
MTRINQLIDSVDAVKRTGTFLKMRPIDTMIIVPSEDLRAVADRHKKDLPFPLRALLRGVAGTDPRKNRLLSFLLFERGYTQELIDLGYRDAMAVKDQLLAFVTGEDVPRLFAPSWVARDLSSFGD